MSVSFPDLFPQPQELALGSGRVLLAQGREVICSIVLPKDSSTLEQTAAQIVGAAIRAKAGVTPPTVVGQPGTHSIPIWIGEAARPQLEGEPAPASADNGAEGYILQASPDGIALRGTGGPGTLYAAQTLVQLISSEDDGASVPVCTLRDWPDLRYRGLYVESKWGPDCMGLDDWKQLIDHMASLKLNFLGVGIYGCWNIQYDQQITEFLMTPLRQFPDLQTPKTITYYSGRRAAWQSLSYLPKMFTEDFFGEVVAYGRERNVVVRPQFNSQGHNTLIPRLYPEISARNAQGWPTGYGFCLSNPATLTTMQAIFKEVLDRYLLPYGVDYFHVGLDEVWDQRGVYPYNPHENVSPWCQCAECSQHEHHELLLKYVFDLADMLKSLGVRHITLWHDQLEKMGLLNADFVQELEKRGLKDHVIINWWRYSPTPFETIRPELGLRRFVVPMTGYYFWSPYHSSLENIESMSRVGIDQGAEGIEAYCTHDPAFDNHQRLLADCGWNRATVDSVEQWQEKYARYVCGDAWQTGLEAIHALDQISAPGSYIGLLLQLDSYRYTYVAADRAYPRDYPVEPLRQLAADPAALTKLEKALDIAVRARAAFADLVASGIPHPDIAEQYYVEAFRSEGLLRIFRNLLLMRTPYVTACEAARAGRVDNVSEAAQQARRLLEEALRWHDQVALELERIKAPYLLPHLLRDWSSVRPYITATMANLDKLPAAVKNGHATDELPRLGWEDVQPA